MSIVHKTLRRERHAEEAATGAAAHPAKSRPAAASASEAELERLLAIIRVRERRIQELERAQHDLDHERGEALRQSDARAQALEAQVRVLSQKLAEAEAEVQRERERRHGMVSAGLQSPGKDAGATRSLLSQAKSRR